MCERAAGFGVFMRHYLGAWRCQRSSIEIEVSEKGGVGRLGRMDVRRAEKVERQRGLRDETIPFSKGVVGVTIAEDGDKMIFVGADGTLRGIDAMLFWGDFLKAEIVFGEGLLEKV